MNRIRTIDARGSVSAVDAAGHRIDVRCEGKHLTLDVRGLRAGLAALSSLKSVRRSGVLVAHGTASAWLATIASDFRIDLRVGGRPVGRAGLDSQPNWLGRALTRLPVELRPGLLLRALLTNV